MYRRILVALGEDDVTNAQVLAEAAEIAQATKGTLNLLHVLFPPSSGFPNPAYITADGLHSTVNTESFQLYLSEWQTLQNKNQMTLDEQANQLSKHGMAVEWTQAVGDPGRQICKIAQDWDADLIMLGRRGLSGLGEILLGSVSSYVMHHAPCSVMAVQGQRQAVTV